MCVVFTIIQHNLTYVHHMCRLFVFSSEHTVTPFSSEAMFDSLDCHRSENTFIFT